jgi:hypothetical protein
VIAALLTQVLKVDEEADMILLNVDLLLAGGDGLVGHKGRTGVRLHGGDWESASEQIHVNLSKLIKDQLNSPCCSVSSAWACILFESWNPDRLRQATKDAP